MSDCAAAGGDGDGREAGERTLCELVNFIFRHGRGYPVWKKDKARVPPDSSYDAARPPERGPRWTQREREAERERERLVGIVIITHSEDEVLIHARKNVQWLTDFPLSSSQS